MSLVPSTLWQSVVDATAAHALTAATFQPLVAWCVTPSARLPRVADRCEFPNNSKVPRPGLWSMMNTLAGF